MNNKPKRNHHVLPKLYLRGFVIKKDEPFIWVYQRGRPYSPGKGKRTNNPYLDSINIAGAERDYYADPKAGGVKDFDTFENKLESLEKPADPVFAKLRAHQAITNEEKGSFAIYMTMMMRRVWSGRKAVKDLLATTPYEPSNELFQKLNMPDTPETRAELKRIEDKVRRTEGIDIQAHNRITAATRDSLLIEVLTKMTWTFYIARPHHAFLTGDNPVFIPAFGLSKNMSELSFPISTEVALVASCDRPSLGGFTEAKPQIVDEINRRSLSGSSLCAYFSESAAWVVKLFNNAHYEYQPCIP